MAPNVVAQECFIFLLQMAIPPSHVQALLPDEQMLSLESIQEGESCVLVYATTLDKRARCPVCNRISRSIHSHYYRVYEIFPGMGRELKFASAFAGSAVEIPYADARFSSNQFRLLRPGVLSTQRD
jgi:hypothetical protein